MHPKQARWLYEAHIWHAGKQVFIGSFGEETLAARCRDQVAIVLQGPASAVLNFSVDPQEAHQLLSRWGHRPREFIQTLREVAKQSRPAPRAA